MLGWGFSINSAISFMLPVEKTPQLMKDQQLAVRQGDIQAINPGLPTEGWISVTLLSHRGAPDPSKVVHGLWAEGSSAFPCKSQISGWMVEMWCGPKLASEKLGHQERRDEHQHAVATLSCHHDVLICWHS